MGLSPSAKSQKIDLKLAPVWGGKASNLLRKVIEFRGSVGLTHSAKSQKMDRKLIPVWGGKTH